MPIRSELLHLYRDPKWQATRIRIRRRAGNRCERCRARNGSVGYWDKNGQLVEYVGQIVPPDVRLIRVQCGCAHLDHEDIERFYDDSNLAWLCRGDHLRFDAAKHKDTRSARRDGSRPLLTLLLAERPIPPSTNEAHY